MNHREVMVSLAQLHGWKRGVELGLASGQLFSKFLSECPDLFMVGVDKSLNFPRRDQVRVIARQYPGRCIVYERLAMNAANLVADASVDFVFIDADHSYRAVQDDIKRWMPKVRLGGMLCGHDYDPLWPGVIKAVDEAFGSRVKTHDGFVWTVQL